MRAAYDYNLAGDNKAMFTCSLPVLEGDYCMEYATGHTVVGSRHLHELVQLMSTNSDIDAAICELQGLETQ